MKRVFYAQAVYGQEEIDAVLEVLRNRGLALMDGPSVKTFEARVATLFGKTGGVMVNSGSSANALAVAALDLPAGSEIITPALTFSTTVAPLLQQRLVPAFVDVEPDTFNVDAARIEEMIGAKTRALMIPNLIGNLPDWPALRAIADRHKLTVIEDSADTLGALWHGKPTGTLTDISTTSFYASHVVTCAGFGGMVAFHEEKLAARARLLRGWGRSSSLKGESESIEDRFAISVSGIPYDSKFVFEAVGYNFLPSEIGAAFGLAQLDKLQKYIEVRDRNFSLLREFFRNHEDWFVLPRQRAEVRTAWLAFPLIVREDAPFSRRDLQIHFEKNNVQTRTVFTGNILRQPGFRDIPRRECRGGYPNADKVMAGGILLGCHQGLDQDAVAYICDVFRDFARRH
ncbi:MAG: aminotransferase class I/II-fold pyridoxal phosphate-dependent enzyme [Alphaproteobacteria bacterium]|nr:aminotransferase class I/II-fold pyridoxal phosphate-dependent enzyme [Alphaproteobacteria bacterium]